MVLILRSSESLITINIPLLLSAVLVLQGGNMIPILHMEQKFRTFQTEKSELWNKDTRILDFMLFGTSQLPAAVRDQCQAGRAQLFDSTCSAQLGGD